MAVASSSNAYAIPFSSCSRLLQSKQVVKEQDQQIIFVVEKGYLRQLPKDAWDRGCKEMRSWSTFFLLPKFSPKNDIKIFKFKDWIVFGNF